MTLCIYLLYSLTSLDRYDKKLVKLTRYLHKKNILYQIVLSDETPKVEFDYIIILDSKIDKDIILPDWIDKCQCPVLGLGKGMELIAKHLKFPCVKLETVEDKIINVSEITPEKQIIKPVHIHRNVQVKNVTDDFDVLMIDDEENILHFTDGKKWHGIQYDIIRSRYIDMLDKFLIN